MKALKVWLNKEEWSKNISRIIDPEQVVEIEDTILDPCVQAEGAIFKLPCEVQSIFGDVIKEIKLPPIKHTMNEQVYLVNQIALVFNNVLRIVEDVAEGKLKPSHLQTSVRRFQSTVIDALGGKEGYINRLCVTSRVRNTLRAVALPNSSWSMDWVGIPGHIMEAMGKKHGDLCMVVRFPAIWDGSCEILRARKTAHSCIEVHPLLHKQFGLDHDGDTMTVYWIPDDEECQKEAEDNVAGFVNKRTEITEWPVQLRFPGVDNKPVDFPGTDNLQSAIKDKFQITGTSISPDDIVGGAANSNILELERKLKKSLSLDNIRIAAGLSKVDFTERLLKANTLNLMMKMYMGPVGATCNKIKIICMNAPPWVQRSAMDVSEKLQQSLLDSKHFTGEVEEQKFLKIIRILNRRGKMRTAMPSQIFSELKDQDLETEDCRPLIAYVHWVYPCLMLLESVKDKINQEDANVIVTELLALTEKRMGEYKVVTDTRYLNITRRICKKSWDETTDYETWGKEMTDKFWNFNSGISNIIKNDFPVFQFVGRQQDGDMNPELAQKVLIKRENDKHGICQRTINMMEGGQVYGDQTD